MVENRNYSFFGQSTGMFIQSFSKSEPHIFLRFIKKKGDGTWEKLSAREGKSIKCSLEELIMMLKVLNRELTSWSTVHSFKEQKTPISIKWDGEKIWINVGEYPKMLNVSQIELLRLLMTHLLFEKIEFATVSNVEGNDPVPRESTPQEPNQEIRVQSNQGNPIVVIEEMDLEDNVKKVEGVIVGKTEKALRLKIGDQGEHWVPKSLIKSSYLPEEMREQSFFIESWYFEKNKIAI
ncbi:MAG: hypothetical protein ACFFG0_08545 [Candidatus Thorarchaeota archaeon]